MARNNPSNPFTQDPEHTQQDVPMPIQKAKVMAAEDHPEENAFHTVRIRVYADEATYRAPVLTPMFGSVWIPKEGQDVAVVFGGSDKPWVVGAWYPLDRVEDGEVELPDYEAGDIRLGNHTGSHTTVRNNGSIAIQTDTDEPVDIDHQTAVAQMSADQTIAGDDNYYQVAFDTSVDNPEGIYDTSQSALVVKNDGQHSLHATIEIPLPEQNNRYTLALFRNGTLFKRKNQQSATNNTLSITVETRRDLNENDVIDVRLRQNSGSGKTINSDFEATEFNIQRTGI